MNNKTKKKRIFEFDFIRAVAVISIVLIHYNALYFFGELQRPDLVIASSRFGGVYLGSWGVALFFILSGASLMHVYQGKYKLSTFYKKRFLGIFPMFWIAYLFGFLVLFIMAGSFPFNGIPKLNFIYTILGIDGSIMTVVPTFYILGEWFLGCIICLYVVFPLIKLGVEKLPVVTGVIIAAIFVYMEFFYNLPLTNSYVFLLYLPYLYFGMIFVKYIKKINWIVAIIGAAVIVSNWIIKPAFIPEHIQILYVGIASFVFLFWLGKYVNYINPFTKGCNFLSKYSYTIFLTHHVIISQVSSQFAIANFRPIDSWCLFALCCVLTLISSVLLFKLEKSIMTCFKPLINKDLFKESGQKLQEKDHIKE